MMPEVLLVILHDLEQMTSLFRDLFFPSVECRVRTNGFSVVLSGSQTSMSFHFGVPVLSSMSSELHKIHMPGAPEMMN